MNDTLDSLKQKLATLKELHAGGTLPDDKFQEGKSALERQILELVLNAPATPAAPARAAAPSTGTTTGAAAPTAPAAKPSGLLLAGLLVGIVAVAGAGYFWKGIPALTNAEAPQAAAAADGQAPQHSTNAEQIAAMTEKLAVRLKDKPDDVEGWSMLARSYSVLGKHADALKAYEKASSLRKDDPTLLADYADSLAVNSNNNLEGEPMKLVERALKLDPKNLKALYLDGTYSFNKKDYKRAVKVWETLVQVGPAGNVFVREVEPAIAEARKLAGMPPPAQPLDAAPQAGAAQPAAGPAPAAAGGGTVSGTVTLSAALAKQAQPEDTVFVFARAATGSRMPLAILRKQVKDLPISFTLNDSMAMSPSNALSSVPQVIVGARISKSGNAMPQPGDLSGQTDPVKVGATGLKIEIKDAVKP
jgi:cytochrome c-type biogenesis protein CcmH